MPYLFFPTSIYFYNVKNPLSIYSNQPWSFLEENLLPELCTNMVCLQLARTCTKSLYPMRFTPFELGGLKYMHIKPNPQNLGLFHLYCHCVKSVHIRSFSGPYFSAFRYSPYLSVFSPNAGKYGQEKLRIRILFTQWLIHWQECRFEYVRFNRRGTWYRKGCEFTEITGTTFT